MLIVTRRIGERLHIGDNIVIEIVDTEGPRARVGVDAPRDIRVVRGELERHDKPVATDAWLITES